MSINEDVLKGKMNKPEDLTIIDLMEQERDYKQECERLAGILEVIKHEREDLEAELHYTQLLLEKYHCLFICIKALLDREDL